MPTRHSQNDRKVCQRDHGSIATEYADFGTILRNIVWGIAFWLGVSALMPVQGLAHSLDGHQNPVVDMANLQQVAPDVFVAADRRIPLVPNIGIITGKEAILVVDAGLGKNNGERVYKAALQIAKGRRIYLTTTHFHPEHSFGASAFPPSSLIMNAAQLDELRDKGPAYLEMFRKISPAANAALVDTVPVKTATVYHDRYVLDLGGVKVELRAMPAHTRGDQTIFVPKSRVLFSGDLAETRFFPVLIDKDSNGEQWIEVLRQMIALRPAVVVPGHGEVTDGRLLADVRDMLTWMRAEVARAVAQAIPLDIMAPQIEAAARQRYPGWDNAQYLGYDIRSFTAAAPVQDKR